MAIRFDNAHYIRSHGRSPRGRGCWIFENADGKEICAAYGTLSDAKRYAIWLIRNTEPSTDMTVFVAP